MLPFTCDWQLHYLATELVCQSADSQNKVWLFLRLIKSLAEGVKTYWGKYISKCHVLEDKQNTQVTKKAKNQSYQFLFGLQEAQKEFEKLVTWLKRANKSPVRVPRRLWSTWKHVIFKHLVVKNQFNFFVWLI